MTVKRNFHRNNDVTRLVAGAREPRRGSLSTIRSLNMQIRCNAFAGIALAGVLAATSAEAQVHNAEYRLPAALAVEAAMASISYCEKDGYRVTAAVVDASGEQLAVIKGDHSTVHTKDTAFRKAYTQVTLGPIFNFDALGAYVEKMKGNNLQGSLLTVPNIILFPGAVAVKAKGDIVAAIGVGGAPGGEKDEICAAAGLARIKDRLP
jgi:uncharacterized protein GlcG (DUF336 family)